MYLPRWNNGYKSGAGGGGKCICRIGIVTISSVQGGKNG